MAVNRCLNQTNYLGYLVNTAEAEVDAYNKNVLQSCPVSQAYYDYLRAKAKADSVAIEYWTDNNLANYKRTVEQDYSTFNKEMDDANSLNHYTCVAKKWNLPKAPCLGTFHKLSPPSSLAPPPKPGDSGTIEANPDARVDDSTQSNTAASQKRGSSYTIVSAQVVPPHPYWPTFHFPLPHLPFDIPWPGWRIFIFAITITLDLVEIIFKTLRTLDSVGTAIEGEWEEEELEERVYDEEGREVNVLKEEVEKLAKMSAQVSTGIIGKINFFFTGWIYYVWKNWVQVVWKLQQVIYLIVILVFLSVIGFILFTILTPGIVESWHLTSIIVQPVQVNLINSNNDIILNAMRLNSQQAATVMKQQQTSVQQLSDNVDIFNTRERQKMAVWKAQYDNVKNAYLGLPPPENAADEVHFCNTDEYIAPQVNFTDLLRQADEYSSRRGDAFVFCVIDPVLANIFIWHEQDTFTETMIAQAKLFIVAVRTVILSFFEAIAVFVGVCLVMDVGFEMYHHLMKRYGGVRVRHRYWFEPKPGKHMSRSVRTAVPTHDTLPMKVDFELMEVKKKEEGKVGGESAAEREVNHPARNRFYAGLVRMWRTITRHRENGQFQLLRQLSENTPPINE